jgi:hypothetical protein
MVNRRAMITGTAFGGVLSALAEPASAEAAGVQQATDTRATEDVAKAIQALRDEVARQYTFWEIAAVRDQIRTFVRLNGKFPDYIDVGTDVWQQVHDWHVRFQQPATIGRLADGRYSIKLMATVVVMRPDVATGFIGMPYDNR